MKKALLLTQSIPVSANISIVGKNGKEIYKGVSPTSVTLKSGMGYFKKAEYLVKLSSPGFPEKSFRSTSKSMAGILGIYC